MICDDSYEFMMKMTKQGLTKEHLENINVQRVDRYVHRNMFSQQPRNKINVKSQ